MRAIALAALLSACTSTAAPPPAAPAPAPATPPTLDRDAAIARTNVFFDAVDHRDVDVMDKIVTSGFMLFEDGGARTMESLRSDWKPAPGRPPVTRTCKDEEVHAGDGIIVYTGDCTEHVPAFKERKASDWEGWNTVVMVHVDGVWKVALWQWQLGGADVQRQNYNATYARPGFFPTEPNKLLVSAVAGVKPGKALLLAMGQGRNALYLAAHGWTVTGVDVSDVGIAAAKKAAAAKGLTLDAEVANIDKYDFGTNRWDLATMLYAGNSKDWIARLKTAIKPGGMIVVEFFHYKPGDPGRQDWRGFATGELARELAGWTIVRDEVVDGVADWGGKQKTSLVRFVARKPSGP